MVMPMVLLVLFMFVFLVLFVMAVAVEVIHTFVLDASESMYAPARRHGHPQNKTGCERRYGGAQPAEFYVSSHKCRNVLFNKYVFRHKKVYGDAAYSST